MDVLAPLLVGAFGLCVFVLPIAAFVRAGNARAELARVRDQIRGLSEELARLRAELATKVTSPGASPEAPSPRETTEPAKPPALPGPAAVPSIPAPAPELAVPPLLPQPAAWPASAEPVIRQEPIALVPATEPPVHERGPTAEPSAGSAPEFNWERFMGAKLFAWLGGLALFLAAAYFIKYSFERNLIPPEVRVGCGLLLGLGLVVGGVRMRRKAYVITSHTLCATGVVILYAVTFACRTVYHFAFFGPTVTFLLMTLITAGAFLLAVRMDALVVAILGMAGGFLTPVLLSTGQDNPVGLFTYIALLDLGLMAIALFRPWPFLVVLAAAGTVVIQMSWSVTFFTAEKIATAGVVFLGFDALFLGGWELARRRAKTDPWWHGAAAGMAISTLCYALILLSVPALADRPGWLGSIVLGADLCLITLALRHPALPALQLAGGGLAHLFVGAWTLIFLTQARLPWALGGVLLFAILHSLFPILRARWHPQPPAAAWAHLFPLAALVLLLVPLTKLATVSMSIWMVILLIDLLAMGLAMVTASLLSILAVLCLTVLLGAVWILRIPADLGELPMTLSVVGAMACVFLFAGLPVMRRVAERLRANGESLDKAFGGLCERTGWSPEEMMVQLPALSALLPFLLLMLIVERLPLGDPSLVFALGLALVVLLLSVARAFRQMLIAPIGLACALLLQAGWQLQHFVPARGGLTVLWLLAFFLMFLGFPFVSRRSCENSILPWAVAALALPLHFPLLYRVVKLSWPNEFMGLLPAAAALPLLAGLAVVGRWFPAGHPRREALLAWFGGAALFFITLIFPVQFERQWITLGWALEGVGLCWLFHRVPHPGLQITGVSLLVAAFVRLGLNPEVYGYHLRSAIPIWNWYLYTYGTVIAGLFVGARLLAPPRDRIGKLRAPVVLVSLGAVLAFLLVNIEIADYFTPPGRPVLTFDLSGGFAQGMTYTIAWATFALVLVIAGLRKHLRASRYAGLALLGITLLKLFLHDLAQLRQLYRIGALAAVAVVAIVASFLYQKFLAEEIEPKP